MELDIRRPERETAPGQSPRILRRLEIVGHDNRVEAKAAAFQARTIGFVTLTG